MAVAAVELQTILLTRQPRLVLMVVQEVAVLETLLVEQ